MSNHKHHHPTKINRRNFLQKFTYGCASVGLTSTLSGLVSMQALNAAARANRPAYKKTGYKAIVCLMLNGGNDSYNMLVPRGTSEYQEYANTRTNIALNQSDLLPINPTNVTGKDFGLHPELTNLQTLFENGNAAFIANMGALVEPTTLASYQADTITKPIGLFSHSDQRMHWQTSVPQNANALGWGGRLADILHTNNVNQDISMNISLSGINLFQQGNVVREYAISTKNDGAINVNNATNTGFYQTLKRSTMDNLLDQTYQNILERAFAGSISESKSNSIQFSSAIAAGTPFTTVFQDTSISNQLKMVARTIASRNILNVRNQTFFVSMGGYDTHDDFLADHEVLMSELDDGVGSFYAAMQELGIEQDVVLFTMSDFSRKLITNGDGADHAWGGHHFVVGGGVNGQRILGQYPDLYLGNPLDVGTGRIIPTTSCDEYFADLALWFGASSADLNQILPNITNFWSPTGNVGPLGLFV